MSPLIFAEGFLFVFGGQDENKQTLNSGEKYDPDANSWTALPPMNEVKRCFLKFVWYDFFSIYHFVSFAFEYKRSISNTANPSFLIH